MRAYMVTVLVSRSTSVTSAGGSSQSKYRESIPFTSIQTQHVYTKRIKILTPKETARNLFDYFRTPVLCAN